MSKKRIIAIIASLFIVLGISYGAYASVTKSQHSAASSTSQVSKKKSSSKDAQPQEIGLKGKAKAKKSAKTTKTSKKAESAKAESEKKVAASNSQASSSQKVAAQKAAEESSTQQQAAASTSQAAAQSQQAATQAAAKQPAANANQQTHTTDTATQPETKKVTISIYGPISEGNKLLINHDSVAMNDGEKVIDVLKRDTAGHGMALSYKGAGSTVYVQGINGLFEFDRGQQSGWLYRVNGVFPNYSCGSYTIKSGDVIEWMYTEDLGHDRNAPQG